MITIGSSLKSTGCCRYAMICLFLSLSFILFLSLSLSSSPSPYLSPFLTNRAEKASHRPLGSRNFASSLLDLPSFKHPPRLSTVTACHLCCIFFAIRLAIINSRSLYPLNARRICRSYCYRYHGTLKESWQHPSPSVGFGSPLPSSVTFRKRATRKHEPPRSLEIHATSRSFGSNI